MFPYSFTTEVYIFLGLLLFLKILSWKIFEYIVSKREQFNESGYTYYTVPLNIVFSQFYFNYHLY